MGAENVPANMEVNYYKWKSWIAALSEDDDCVAAKLENAARKLQENVDVQTEGKWGVEALDKAVKDLEAGDEDAQATLEATLKTIPSSYVSEEMKAIWEGDATGSPQIPPDLDF